MEVPSATCAGQCADAGVPPLSPHLDGYPIDAMLHLCATGEASENLKQLGERLLAAWVDHLTHDIDQIPAASPDVIASARQRMVDTRNALLQLRGRFEAQHHEEDDSRRRAAMLAHRTLDRLASGVSMAAPPAPGNPHASA